MSEEKKKFYRLFAVAKELNVGISTLVEHLEFKGFSVSNSPNEKLTSEMHAVLLKEFASEKDLKEKAEQIRELKRESKNQQEELSSDEPDFLSAEQLKNSLFETTARTTTKVETPTVRQEKPVEPVKEEAPAKVEPTTVPEADSDTGSGIKVVGKIDLSQFDRKGKKVQKEEPPVEKEKPKTVETPVQEKPVQQPEPKTITAPVSEKVEPEVVEKKEVKPEPVQPVVEAKKEVETPKTPTPAEQPEAEADTQKDEVIRASDSAPTLRGLTIKGKIELPSDKKAKKSVAPAGKTEGEGDDDSDEKKKRKRKRKRKKPTTTPDQNSQQGGPKKPGDNNNNNKGPRPAPNQNAPKKEEPSEREIRDLIKNTLADIDKRSGKTRQRLRRAKRDEDANRRDREAQRKIEDAKTLEVTEFLTANELARLMDVTVTEIITKCLQLGLFVSINQRLDSDVIHLLADEYGYNVKFVDITDQDYQEEEEEDEEDQLVHRAPIITVMGHVDHGKTLLLDSIRRTNVVAGEAGGITQHIGAYEVILDDERKITFLDTPGHEAFTAMRARGAKLTDVAIIVVAADDAVMPQTKEAINHAEAAGVPIIFAINKIDKPSADPERIKHQLAELNYLVEDWGGKYQSQEISAKANLNIDKLLEKVLLEAELLDLKANPDKPAKGTVVESRLEKGRGVVASLLVQEGTLKVGDSFVAGIHYGRVRALLDERGRRVKEAGPSQPVEVLGLTGTPQAGDRFIVYEEEKKAKEIAGKRHELDRQHKMRARENRSGLESWSKVIQEGNVQDLNIIVKGDVDGSVEALSDSLIRLSTSEVRVTVVMKGVGQITDNDVNLASASKAIIIGFQVRPNSSARKLADNEGVEIRLYSIIYDAIEEIKAAMTGMLSPEIKEEINGSAEVRDIFKISKVGTIAGCMVTDGKVTRTDPIRLVRDGVVIYQGKIGSLKRFKDDAREVLHGFECGIMIDGYNDLKEGDLIESFKRIEVERKSL